jgi:hypothetical protein
MNPLTVAALERQIEDLIASYPELAEEETLRADVIEGETDATKILSRVVNRMQEADAMCAVIVKRKNDLDSRQARYERESEAMRSLAFRIMTAAGQRKMPLPEATLSISTRPPALAISDATQLPAEFTVTKTETRPDREKIKEALKAGQEVPGAYLTNGSETLSVRSR